MQRYVPERAQISTVYKSEKLAMVQLSNSRGSAKYRMGSGPHGETGLCSLLGEMLALCG